MSSIVIIDSGLTFTILDPPHDYVGSNTNIVHVPSSAAAGDLNVLFDMPLSATATHPTFVIPSGWTHLVNNFATSDGGEGARCAASYRVLTSGNVDTDITGMNGGLRNRKIMITLRPSRPIQSVTPSGWVARCDPGDPGSILVPAPAAPGGGAVVFIGLSASQNAHTLSWSPAADDVNATGTLVTRAGFKLYRTGVTPSAHTIDIADAGDINAVAAGCLIIT